MPADLFSNEPALASGQVSGELPALTKRGTVGWAIARQKISEVVLTPSAGFLREKTQSIQSNHSSDNMFTPYALRGSRQSDLTWRGSELEEFSQLSRTTPEAAETTPSRGGSTSRGGTASPRRRRPQQPKPLDGRTRSARDDAMKSDARVYTVPW